MDRDSILPPLHVILCREQNIKPTAELADAVVRSFRGNISGEDSYLATISDLPVPIRDFSGCPEINPKDLLDRSLHTLVVILANEKMEADGDWPTWIKACEKHVAGSKGRHKILVLCAPDSLNSSSVFAWRRRTETVGFNEIQKDGAPVFGEYAERRAWFALYVMQTCRHLLAKAAFDAGNKKALLKLRLFISHAKKDSLPLANSLRSALKQKDYFSYWYDAKDLQDVQDWRLAIKDGVNNSVVVVLRTEEYDSRPWCRQEFVWACQCAVPIVCIEARNSLEYGADELAAGRAPTVRIPDGNLFRVLFGVLKESLRILQLERRLGQLQDCHDGIKHAKRSHLIPYTPNLSNLTHAAKVIAKGRRKSRGSYVGYNVIFYADPPLKPELYHASKDFIEQKCGMTYMLTPTLLPFWNASASIARSSPKKIQTRSLLGKSINISISEHEQDLKRLGFSINEVNSFTVQLAQAMIGNEAIVALGHDWRDTGVMREIYRYAEEHQDVVLSEDERKGLIRNYCFWGMVPGLSDYEQNILRGILDIIVCKKPADKRLADTLEGSKELFPYGFARALTVMRREMTENVFARVCLGGRDMDPAAPHLGPKGRCPGLAEEALMSCLVNQPLYLSGLLGGVTQQVINAINGEKAELQFKLAGHKELAGVVMGYETSRIGRKPILDAKLTRKTMREIYRFDGILTSEEILEIFRHYGVARLAANNGLSIEENLYLFQAATIEEVINWVLTGLARLRCREAA